MHPRVREIVAQSIFILSAVEEIASLLPADDAELQDWLTQATTQRDAALFTYLVSAALLTERHIASTHIGSGLHLLTSPVHPSLFVWNAKGEDIPEQVLQALQDHPFHPSDQALLHCAISEWSKIHRNGTYPPELLTHARLLARDSKKLDSNARSFLMALGFSLPDQRLISLLVTTPSGSPGYEEILKLSTKLSLTCQELFRTSIATIIPKEHHHKLAGFTVRRSVEHTGRNEPCHCGSGKKYKHCCSTKDIQRLQHSTHIPGKTQAEVAASLEQHLDKKTLLNTHPTDLIRIDSTKIKPELLSLFHTRLCTYHLWEEYLTSIQNAGWGKEIHPTIDVAFFHMCRDGRKELVQRLLDLRRLHLDPPAREVPEDYVRLILVRDEPLALLQTIHDIALESVEADHFIAAYEFALGLLFSPHPALGILVARAVIPIAEKEFALKLLDEILIAREKLNLCPNEPAADILDKRFANDAIAGGAPETAKLREARQKLKSKAEEVRRIQADLDRLRSEVERREATQAQKQQQKQQQKQNTPAPAPAPDPEILRDLRQKVATLKSALKHHHQERDTLRRDLSKTLTDLESLRESKSTAPAAAHPAHDAEDHHIIPGDIDGNQPPRIIEFPKKFHHTLSHHPRHIARSALVLLGRLAAGEPDAFIGVVRLKQRPDTLRARIGIDHRLLFRLDSEVLHVVDLIPRQDLERRIKTL